MEKAVTAVFKEGVHELYFLQASFKALGEGGGSSPPISLGGAGLWTGTTKQGSNKL